MPLGKQHCLVLVSSDWSHIFLQLLYIHSSVVWLMPGCWTGKFHENRIYLLTYFLMPSKQLVAFLNYVACKQIPMRMNWWFLLHWLVLYKWPSCRYVDVCCRGPSLKSYPVTQKKRILICTGHLCRQWRWLCHAKLRPATWLTTLWLGKAQIGQWQTTESQICNF